MSTDNKYTSILTLFLAPCFLFACGNGRSGGADGAAAGRGGSGGSLATGGSVETGGMTNVGGQRTGGETAAGGSAVSSGGQPTGGASASGGSTATIATTTTGGSLNSGGETSGGGTTDGSTSSGGSRSESGADAAVGGSTRSGGSVDVATSGSAGSGGLRFDGGVDAASGGSSSGGAHIRTLAWTERPPDLTPTEYGRRGKDRRAQTIKNANYAGTSSASQTLDLLLPANALLPLPLVVRMHGGGFSSGDKAGEETGPAANAILAKGYALASVNYRLSGQALFPAGVQDVKAACVGCAPMPPNMDWTLIALRLGASRQEAIWR